MFQNRTYRRSSQREGLAAFTITVKETDLHIQADEDLTEKALRSAMRARELIESFIETDPEFLTSLVPVHRLKPVPVIIRQMLDAGTTAGVGPMAAVAGAVAQFTGRELLENSKEVIVENGGDIFIKTSTDTVIGIWAGKSPLSMRVGIRIKQRDTAYALCTSSGTLGHSKSFGRADAVTILSPSCALADTVATAMGNKVQKESEIQQVIDTAKSIPKVEGVVIIKGKSLGAWGDLELVTLG